MSLTFTTHGDRHTAMEMDSFVISVVDGLGFRSPHSPEEPLHSVTSAAGERIGEPSTRLSHPDSAKMQRIDLDRQQATFNGSLELDPGCLRLVRILDDSDPTEGLVRCSTYISPIEASEKYTAVSYAA